MFGLGDPSDVCQFSNILQIWGDPALVNDHFEKELTYDDKLKLAKSLQCYTHGWCYTHNQFCPFQKSRSRVQGPPCPDWSPAGKRRGVQGPDLPTMLASGRKSELTCTHVVTVENAKKLPQWLVEDAYGGEYSWVYTQQTPALVGFEFMSRERTALG